MKVAVVVGGDSEERDISIASGFQIAKALRSIAVETLMIDTASGLLSAKDEVRLAKTGIGDTPPPTQVFSWLTFIDNVMTSPKLKDVDVYFLALHGGSGENGTLQAFFDLIKKPYTGSGHLASACAFDKALSKKIMACHQIPTPDWILADPNHKEDIISLLGLPLIVKPNQQGSTVGLSVVRNQAALSAAIHRAKQFDEAVIIEKFIAGREITAGVLDHQALAVGEIVLPKDSEFDYQAKYQPGVVREIFPADVTPKIAQQAKRYAEVLHEALGLYGYSRTDFRLDESGQLWCLEINSLPGMTQQSLLPQAATASGISFAKLCLTICQLAQKRFIGHHDEAL
ncbi:MAG: D-alanine--D-alanine ligase [Neisseriales bacterium]|nr:MAG: D-alanine--D-alanine ligase [Neisseriales bacterium]